MYELLRAHSGPQYDLLLLGDLLQQQQMATGDRKGHRSMSRAMPWCVRMTAIQCVQGPHVLVG